MERANTLNKVRKKVEKGESERDGPESDEQWGAEKTENVSSNNDEKAPGAFLAQLATQTATTILGDQRASSLAARTADKEPGSDPESKAYRRDDDDKGEDCNDDYDNYG